VFEWLTDCLRDPSGTYELITPTRRPLVTSMGTVRAADLLPSVRSPRSRAVVLRGSLLVQECSSTASARICDSSEGQSTQHLYVPRDCTRGQHVRGHRVSNVRN